jgi:hypothetical protein
MSEQEPTLPKPTKEELTRTQTFIQALSQPLSPWEYIANALIQGVIIFAVFSAGNYLVAQVKEARSKM